MVTFWDTSALLPLILPEASTSACLGVLGDDPAILYWWGTIVEIDSALERRTREGTLTRAELARSRAAAERLLGEGSEAEPNEDVRQTARLLLRLHPLRAADALQLAAAMTVAGSNRAALRFVSLDRRLREAAAGEGLTVLP